eukprot:3968136-Pleurochrysis_carterae.AAC.4
MKGLTSAQDALIICMLAVPLDFSATSSPVADDQNLPCNTCQFCKYGYLDIEHPGSEKSTLRTDHWLAGSSSLDHVGYA